MSLKHQVTFYCDSCETEFMIDEELMELPPAWLGMQIVIADSDGCVPDHEREIFCHFCSQECLIEYANSQQMRERLIWANESVEEDGEDGSEEDGLEDNTI